MKLEILISTHKAGGIRRLAQPSTLPRIDGVGYLISWQRMGCYDDVPQALIDRDDVRVVECDGRGSGANRDNCIKHAIGPWCLCSDDDLRFIPDGIKALADTLERHSDVDFGVARAIVGDRRETPEESYDISAATAKTHFPIEFEIFFRLDSIKRHAIGFNHNFGAGVERYSSCEGALFMRSCRQAKLRGRYFPITIEEHPGLTTSQRIGSYPGVLRGEGVNIALMYPVTGLARAVLMGWRRTRGGGNPLSAFLYVAQGYFDGMFRRKKLGII